MSIEIERSQAARAAAELALVRVVHHYGSLPEFVVLGGLVPQLLCSSANLRHAGTTDIDVQVDLEIAAGAVNAARLERALIAAGFSPDDERVWRWVTPVGMHKTEVKFELLADLDTEPAGATVKFEGAETLGAANLRGTGSAVADVQIRTLTALDGQVELSVDVQVTGIAGFLLAKVAAAQSRRKPKDWYDIAFVLLHNDEGGPQAATQTAIERLPSRLRGVASGLQDLAANFSDEDAQGPAAYAGQLLIDHPEMEPATAAADAQLAIEYFCSTLLAQIEASS